MDWYPWHYKKFKDKTLHLTAEQDGMYRRLIDYYMEIRKPIPSDDISLARICGVDTSCFKQSSSILKAFFRQCTSGALRHDMCDEMLDEQDKKARFHSERAKKGAKARHAKKENVIEIVDDSALSKQEAMLALATITVNSNNKILDTNVSNKNLSETEFEMLFLKIWEAYIGQGASGIGASYKGSKNQAFRIFVKLAKKQKDPEAFTEILVNGAINYANHLKRSGSYSKHVTTWLNSEGWKDDYSSSNVKSKEKQRGDLSAYEASIERNKAYQPVKWSDEDLEAFGMVKK